MIRVLLCCAAGMSTSLLVTKMEKSAADRGIEAKIWAVSEKSVDAEEGNYDVLLVGPQIRYKLKELEKKCEGKCPVSMIDMRDYGRMDGEKVLDLAVKLYDEFYK
ncbi:PTS sugar transporter subunit IIB [Beduini massiliensis]|uniref:PTS sugar transporter subunit IIB n=1 Tax=Beduini massiliensis TaxID=1585974 RepID=UPI00059AA60D|nr:PTS sugar transporter subunit IIB [Beduini massiliensis]